MGKITGISWTDHSFNPWHGCTKVSAGCDHCYAEAFDKRVGGAHWGKDQENYDLRFHRAMDVASFFRVPLWVSYEPALGPLTIAGYYHVPDWIIFGGESGANRRECKREWADNLLRECREVGTRFFMKQMSGRTPAEGKAAIPPELMVQEFP